MSVVNLFVRDCWYVAAWCREVVDDRLFSRTLLGEPVCLYRTTSGRLVALADRCAHRGAPLSRGRREGDSVRCLYHGMKFDSTGQCDEMPGQDRPPPRACVRSYPVVERDQWVWIWMGDPARADPAQIPAAWSLDRPAWPYKPGYCHYAAPHLLVCDNLLDFSHLGYVHPTTLGGTENIAASRPKITRSDSAVRVERWLMNEVPAPFHLKVGDFSGRVDRWYVYDFHVPGVLVMHSGVQAAGTGAAEGHIRNALEFRSCQAVTPETAESSHYFYAVPRNFAIDDPHITDTLFQQIVDAFEEDRVIIEAQARNLELDPDWSMTAAGVDAALSQFRWLMGMRLSAERDASARVLETRQTVAG